MKLLRFFIFSFLFFSEYISGQRSSLTDTSSISHQKIIPDSSSNEIQAGIIYVRKPHISPFVKVTYKLYLAHVNPKGGQREVGVTDKNAGFTDTQIEIIPTFDSNMYSKKLARDYPVNADPLSRYFVENLNYRFQPNDTPRVDTMLYGMWIDSRGKVKYIMPDSNYDCHMSSALIRELDSISWRISNWGTGGGYHTPKKFLRPAHFVGESYYCEVYVIVSSYPLTVEQKKTGTSYAPFDYPLNCPAIDPEQKASLECNSPSATIH